MDATRRKLGLHFSKLAILLLYMFPPGGTLEGLDDDMKKLAGTLEKKIVNLGRMRVCFDEDEATIDELVADVDKYVEQMKERLEKVPETEEGEGRKRKRAKEDGGAGAKKGKKGKKVKTPAIAIGSSSESEGNDST
jgi:hypothetical protein